MTPKFQLHNFELYFYAMPKTLAVLPFINISASSENEFFSDGITEEIINALSKIKNLKVTSRTSSFYFKSKNIPLKQIAKELKVSAVLEGSVRVAGIRFGFRLN